jgi:hypothetical protein
MTSGSIFWVVIIAGSGGVFVLVGLLMELFSEKELHKNVDDFRRCKSRKILGERLVIFGIAIEIFVAGWTAIDEWQNDPLNQPIASVSANVSLVTAGTNHISGVNSGSVNLQFERLDQVTVGINWQAHVLICSDWYWNKSAPNWWSLKFNQGIETFFDSNSVVRDAKDWNAIVLNAPFLYRDTEIVGGRIKLTVNSTVFEFPIPPQKAKGQKDLVNFFKNPTNSVTVFGE